MVKLGLDITDEDVEVEQQPSTSGEPAEKIAGAEEDASRMEEVDWSDEKKEDAEYIPNPWWHQTPYSDLLQPYFILFKFTFYGHI